MRILVVDASTEGQASLAERINGFDPVDLESLDIAVNLAGPNNYLDIISKYDVLVIGAEFGSRAKSIAYDAKAAKPEIEIIMFVSKEDYSSGAFRAAHSIRARKVIPISAPALDLLQELVRIHEEFRATGKIRNCRVVAVTQAKGSVGATSLCAALGELCSTHEKRVLLWDLDIETRDLTRALLVEGKRSKIVGSWIRGLREVSRKSIEESLTPLNSNAFLLMPPQAIEESMDLVGQPNGVRVIYRILDLARTMFDIIIVDCAGRFGPGTGAVLRAADTIVMMVDDSVLGLTAVPPFMSYLTTLIDGDYPIRFLCSGTKAKVENIAAEIGRQYVFQEEHWQLAPLPFDPAVECWAGTGKTIYSLGSKNTRRAIGQIGYSLNLLGSGLAVEKIVAAGLKTKARKAENTDFVREPELENEIYRKAINL
jgi:cellulose biosynthesis protein BcsQ